MEVILFCHHSFAPFWFGTFAILLCVVAIQGYYMLVMKDELVGCPGSEF